MSGIETDNKERSFLRVHKSYIVNMKQLHKYDSNSLKVQDKIIPVGRVYKIKVETFLKK